MISIFFLFPLVLMEKARLFSLVLVCLIPTTGVLNGIAANYVSYAKDCYVLQVD